jgi:hypothetical protein
MAFRVLAGVFAIFVWLGLGIAIYHVGLPSDPLVIVGAILLAIFALGLSVACVLEG